MSKVKVVEIVLALCLTCSACSSIPLAAEPPAPDITPTLTDQIISVECAVELAEIMQLNAENAGPVVAMTFASDAQRLLVTHSQKGELRHWRLSDGILLKTLDVGPVGLGGAAFDPEGSLLATCAGVEWKTHRLDDEYLGWRVWNTQTGNIVDQVGQSYDSLLTRNLMPDILVSQDGHWVLAIRSSADSRLDGYSKLTIDGVVIEETGEAYVNFSRKAEEDDFDVLAFDAQGEFFAAAGELGQVAVFAFRPPQYPKDAQAIIEKPAQLGGRPLALAFDPRRRWLAGVRGTELIIWNLQSRRYERHIDSTVGDVAGLTASLAFNPSGSLLAVGTANGWQIWNVEEKQMVMQEVGVEVYSVLFSPDGRLFVWGDANGVVHLWGMASE